MQTPSFQEFLTESPADHQERGICQICGREQAVRDKGNITHHGYTIKYGWFDGACPGQRHKPLQHDKTETERQIKLIEKELPELEKTVANLKSGKIRPLQVNVSFSYRNPKMVDWKEAPDWAQRKAVEIAIAKEDQRLRAGRDTITFMENLIKTYYGNELKKVARVDPSKKPKMGVGSVVNIAGQKNVTITKIEMRVARGVGPNLNGLNLDHAFWTDDKGHEHAYPLKLARWPKK